MNIKDTIKALLQSKFGGVQLSDARIEQFAKSLEGKVTTEEELLSRLEAFNELQSFASMRAEDDRARSAQAEIEKLKNKKPASEEKPEEKVEEEDKNKDSELLALLKEMKNEISSIKGEKVITDRRSIIQAKLKDASEEYANKVLRDFGRMSFATDEDFTAYLADVETDFATHVQTEAESKLGKDVPYSGIGGAGLKDNEVSPAMKEMVQQREEAAKAKSNA